jgi:hypothetical protein
MYEKKMIDNKGEVSYRLWKERIENDPQLAGHIGPV